MSRSTIGVLAGSVCALGLFLSPVSAAIVGVKTVTIEQLGGSYLELAEVTAQRLSDSVNVAGQSQGGIASALGSLDGYSIPSQANDGNLTPAYPDTYHSGSQGIGNFWTATLASPTDLTDIGVYGRDNVGDNRDNTLHLVLRDENSVVLFEQDFGIFGPTNNPLTTIVLPVPEPTTLVTLAAACGMLLTRRPRRA